MGRGVSSGGGQSSLGYLFGSDEAPKPSKSSPSTQNASSATPPPVIPLKPSPVVAPPVSSQDPPVDEALPASGTQGNNVNNYHRADGQNSGNFITVWSQHMIFNLSSLSCVSERSLLI